MDYEKKYNKALERAKYYHDRDNIQFLENIFPELADSEDERIRKDLLGYLHTLPNHFSHNGSLVTEWVALLEKQGEHSVSPLFTFDDVLTIQCAMAYAKLQDRELDVALKKLHDKVYDAYHDSINHNIESQDGLKGEQILDNSAKTCKDEQKPADKVEHKRMTKLEDKLSSLVVNAVHIYCKENELDTPHYVGLILGDRLAKEWSRDILTLAKDELKMSEQKPAWKPSDEQMEALEHFVRSITESGFASPYDSNTKLVYSLFNDLKKLKL